MSGGDGPSKGTLAIFFIAAVQLVGAVVLEILHRFKVPLPYSVVLLILGMTVQSLDWGEDTAMGQAVDGASSMDPHLVFMIFLPVLLFESAFSINYHLMMRAITQSFLLAGPGVVISTVLTAIATKFVLTDYGWDWPTCLMFGSILSATDPVAVVALLREVGASKKLAALIEGESLFNDGTAYVFYLVFVQLVHGNEFELGKSTELFCRLALGGPALGIGLGIITAWWLSYCFNNKPVEITTTIFVAYLCFYLSEGSDLRVSGVLSVVCLGIYMSRTQSVVSVAVHDAMHDVWHQISHMANTHIFVLAGLLIVRIFQSESAKDVIGVSDFGYLFMTYFIIHIVRMTTILMLAPFLRRLGYGLTFEDGVILVWGALRGAVGLVLALLVLEDEQIDITLRIRMAFQVAGIVFLTLLVNGTTCGSVLQGLGMSTPFKSQIVLLKTAMTHLNTETELALLAIQQDPFYQGADWAYIDTILPKLNHVVTDRIAHEDKANQERQKLVEFSRQQIERTETEIEMQKFKHKHAITDMSHIRSPRAHNRSHTIALSDLEAQKLYPTAGGGKATNRAATAPITDIKQQTLKNKEGDKHLDIQFLRTEMRTRFLRSMQSSYQELYHHELIDATVYRVLNEATQDAADESNIEATWKYVKEQLMLPKWLKCVQDLCYSNRVVVYVLSSQLLFSVNCLTAYMRAVRQAQGHIQESFVDDAAQHQSHGDSHGRHKHGHHGHHHRRGSDSDSSHHSSKKHGSSSHRRSFTSPDLDHKDSELKFENVLGEVADLKLEIQAFESIKIETKRCLKAAKQEWQSIQTTYPDIYAAVQTQHATSYILHFQRRAVQTLEEEGILSDKECHDLQHEVDKVLHKANDANFFARATNNSTQQPDLDQMAFLAPLGPEVIAKLEAISPHVTDKGDFLFTSRAQHENLQLVLRGNLRAQSEEISVHHVRGVGMIANLPEFMTRLFYGKEGWVKTNGIVDSIHLHTLSIPKEIVIEDMLSNPEVEELMWKLTAVQLFHYRFSEQFPGLSIHDFQVVIHSSEFVKVPANTMTHIISSGFLLTGSVTMQLDNDDAKTKNTLRRRTKGARSRMVVLNSAVELKAPAILAAETTYNFKSECVVILFDSSPAAREDTLSSRLQGRNRHVPTMKISQEQVHQNFVNGESFDLPPMDATVGPLRRTKSSVGPRGSMPGIKGSPLKGKLMTPFSPAEFHLDDSKQQREHKQYSSGQNWSVKVEDTSEQVKVDSKGKNFLYREDMDTSSRDNRRTHNRSNSVSRSSRSSRSSNGYDNSGSDGSSTGSSSYTESSSSESEVDELEAARQARAVTERERELALFKTKFNL